MQHALESLTALAVDCQTTGANAARHHLLEVGWVPVGISYTTGRFAPAAYLVKLPDGAVLPPAVVKLTGICEDDLHAAATPEQVWQNLLETAAVLPAKPHGSERIVLIHYARFELPFLQRLHAGCGGEAFPFHIVCTHAIARRLLPQLPSCSLRALAGYFGHALDDQKRAASHAQATAVIWKYLVLLLATQGIREWSSLTEWLDRPRPSGRVPKQYPMPRSLRLEAPDHPGVYRFLRSNGDLLYIGKARSLKRRINSYFQTRRRHGAHMLEMLTQASRLDYNLTPTALEAALLEADLIKQAAPPYNIHLKPRQTAPVFFSADFQSAGSPDNPNHAIGPLPSERFLKAFCFVVAQCGQPNSALPADTVELAAVLAIPERYLPPVPVFMRGLEIYREICGCRDDLRHAGRQLLKRGLILWRVRQNQDVGIEADDGRTVQDVDGEKEWTAEAVVDMLDGIVRRGGQMVRRGRWLQILANGTLCWNTANPEGAPQRILQIKDGRVRAATEGAADGKLAAPKPTNQSRAACRKIFSSAATYDRLRVLTTEMRRLLAKGRRVTLFPAVGAPIGNKGLERLLDLI